MSDERGADFQKKTAATYAKMMIPDTSLSVAMAGLEMRAGSKPTRLKKSGKRNVNRRMVIDVVTCCSYTEYEI